MDLYNFTQASSALGAERLHSAGKDNSLQRREWTAVDEGIASLLFPQIPAGHAPSPKLELWSGHDFQEDSSSKNVWPLGLCPSGRC